MTDPLGLSLGVLNLGAVRGEQPPVSRRAVLALFDQRPPEVGQPDENPTRTGTGLMVGGFVERVGDPAPVVAADGSTHRGEELAADALEALARLTGYGAPVCIAVPAHWGVGRLDALVTAVRSRPGLNPHGVPPLVVPDATAAVSALRTEPGLPSQGVVALCDFGDSGTSITLVDAATNYRQVAPTLRYSALSGAQLDQTILNHLLGQLPIDGTSDSAGTTAVSSLIQLRDECRAAKERLSTQPATAIPVDLPGFNADVQLTCTELQDIIAAPLAGVVDVIVDILSRSRIPTASLSAVALAGGGANIPMIGARLSEQLRVPLVAAARPGSTAAIGAALLARRPPAPAGTGGTSPADDAPTSLASTRWATGLSPAESAADAGQSATFRALAWSQDSSADEPLPFSGADYPAGPVDVDPGAPGGRSPTGRPAGPEPVRWYKRPALLFGLAAALALVATGGLAYTLTGEDSRAPDRPVESPAPVTVTVTAPNGDTSLSTMPPAPPPDTATESSSTAAKPSSATTTEPPATTQPTSTSQLSTEPTSHATAPQPTQSAQPPASTTAALPTTAAPPGSG